MFDYGGLIECRQVPNQTGSYNSIAYLTDTRPSTPSCAWLRDN